MNTTTHNVTLTDLTDAMWETIAHRVLLVLEATEPDQDADPGAGEQEPERWDGLG